MKISGLLLMAIIMKISDPSGSILLTLLYLIGIGLCFLILIGLAFWGALHVRYENEKFAMNFDIGENS